MKTQENTETKSQILSTEILDSKTLLVVSKNEEETYPIVSVKYMLEDKPHETPIATLTPETIVRYNDQMVAVFLPKGKVIKKPTLVTVYSVARHDFVGNDLLRMDYEVLSTTGVKVKQLRNK